MLTLTHRVATMLDVKEYLVGNFGTLGSLCDLSEEGSKGSEDKGCGYAKEHGCCRSRRGRKTWEVPYIEMYLYRPAI